MVERGLKLQLHGALPSPSAAPKAQRPDVVLAKASIGSGRAFVRAAVLVLAVQLAPVAAAAEDAAPAAAQNAIPIKNRNIEVLRQGATELPRSQEDQALVNDWPLYRTERGQQAFNDAMATLRATDGAPPPKAALNGCAELKCNVSLPSLTKDGWLQPGRMWVSQNEYVLFVHSERLREGQSYRRRARQDMEYFVFHEFHNGTRNTDPFDTISSHSRSVFVPFYMSKQGTDAKGRRFVIVVQVAPYDVESRHASNMDSAGPGIEVAKNSSDALEPLQGLAGILVATIVKTAAPHLKVVNHRGSEGLAMRGAYEARLAELRARPGSSAVVLPFLPAAAQSIAEATGRLEDLIVRSGASEHIPVAERGIVHSHPARAETPVLVGPIARAIRPLHSSEPTLIGPIRPATRPDKAVTSNF